LGDVTTLWSGDSREPDTPTATPQRVKNVERCRQPVVQCDDLVGIQKRRVAPPGDDGSGVLTGAAWRHGSSDRRQRLAA